MTESTKVAQVDANGTSAQELAEILGCEYPVAYNVLKLLEQKNLVTKAGTRRPAGGSGKGRRTIVYTIPESVTLSLTAAPVATDDVPDAA